MRRTSLWLAIALGACAHGSGENIDANGGDTSGPVDSGCGALPCQAIYVSRTGSDSAPGTMAAPLATIGAGIAKAAAATPALAVFVQAGVYPETLAMKPGVSIYGGFDPSWQRSASVVTEIDGHSPAIAFDQIHVATALDQLTVKSADATVAGDSSIAIAVTGSMMVELRDVIVEPGMGAPGATGSDGGTGAGGGAGGSGGPGVEHSTFLCASHTLPVGGTAGTSSCARPGGRGGDPGVGDGAGATGGDGANNPQSGSFGGAGGGHSPPCGGAGDGQAAAGGNPGAPGTSGGGGMNVGTFMGLIYVPSSGANGTGGGPGDGGGGGGGGGGGTLDCDSSGSSGGGGGGGGCGGGLGTAGGGGGGSFGVVAIDSTVTVRASMVLAGPGGAGGHGGKGGGGGTGGGGGPGGPYGGSGEQDDGGCGAPGAPGGAGGAGGHGGGGGGGPSAALVCLGTATIAIPASTISGGVGGAGGTSMGNAGTQGVSTRAIGCSFF